MGLIDAQENFLEDRNSRMSFAALAAGLRVDPEVRKGSGLCTRSDTRMFLQCLSGLEPFSRGCERADMALTHCNQRREEPRTQAGEAGAERCI